MNRAFLIVLTPGLLVAFGSILFMRQLGISFGTIRLILAALLFLGLLLVLAWRRGRKANAPPEASGLSNR